MFVPCWGGAAAAGPSHKRQVAEDDALAEECDKSAIGDTAKGDQQIALTICNSICVYALCVSLYPYPKRQNFSAFTPTLCFVGNAKAKSSRAGLLGPDLIHAAPTASRAARRRHHRRSPWRPEAGRRAERREARACRRSYSGGVVVARGACRRAADECGEQRDGREVWTFSWRPPSEESWSGREAPSFGNSELQTHNADRQLAGIRSWMKAPRASAFVCRNQANAFFTFLKRPLDGHGLDRESAKTG
jgi:hypothetical protein